MSDPRDEGQPRGARPDLPPEDRDDLPPEDRDDPPPEDRDDPPPEDRDDPPPEDRDDLPPEDGQWRPAGPGGRVPPAARDPDPGGATWENGALIRVRGATKIYRQGDLEVPALRGVDLDVAEGEFTVLAGPSGSGKTTLLNLIGALDHPTDGTVVVDGRDVTSLGRGEAADFRLDRVGFVFQAYNLVPVLTAYENAEFTLLLRGMSGEERRARVEPLLERVGLGDLMDRKPHELSGGQQQRVAVVRALATSPAIVLADEPTANLDSATSAELLELMEGLNDELGTTFVFSTHDPVVIERARRIVELLDGRVHASREAASA